MNKKLEVIKSSVKKGWEIFTVCSVSLFAVSSMAGMSMIEYGKTEQEQLSDVEHFIKMCPIAVLVICAIGLGMWIFL